MASEIETTTTATVDVLDEFNYSKLTVEDRILVQQRTKEIKGKIQTVAQAFIEIGQMVIEVKDRLPYGDFTTWINAEFKWSQETARRYMRAAKLAAEYPHASELDFSLKALSTLSGAPPEAVEEAIERRTSGEQLTTSQVQEIVDSYSNNKPEKRYRYTGDTVVSRVGKSVFELKQGAEVYLANISITSPSQCFVCLVGYSQFPVQVNRAELELISWQGWKMGDHAKLIEATSKTEQQWLNTEVEIFSLLEELIEVKVARQPETFLKVNHPNQLSRNIGTWRHNEEFFLIDSPPPDEHKENYTRVDLLSLEDQVSLSRQRAKICQEKLAKTKGKKQANKIQAEIDKELEIQAKLGFPDSGSEQQADNDQTDDDSPKSIQEALEQCPFQVGDYVRDMGAIGSQEDRGFITDIKGRQLGSPKDPHYDVVANITLNSGEEITLQTYYLQKVIFKDLSDVGLSENCIVDAKEMDWYVDYAGIGTILREWVNTTTTERQRIHRFYPGLKGMARRLLDPAIRQKVQVADAQAKSDEQSDESDDELDVLENLPECLRNCDSQAEVQSYLEYDVWQAADEFCEMGLLDRNRLREIHPSIDAELVETCNTDLVEMSQKIGCRAETIETLRIMENLLVADRNEEINQLKAEVEKLKEINRDLHSTIAGLQSQVHDLQKEIG